MEELLFLAILSAQMIMILILIAISDQLCCSDGGGVWVASRIDAFANF